MYVILSVLYISFPHGTMNWSVIVAFLIMLCVCVFSLPHSAIMIVTFPDPTVCHFICLFFNFSSLRYHELVCDCRIS